MKNLWIIFNINKKTETKINVEYNIVIIKSFLL